MLKSSAGGMWCSSTISIMLKSSAGSTWRSSTITWKPSPNPCICPEIGAAPLRTAVSLRNSVRRPLRAATLCGVAGIAGAVLLRACSLFFGVSVRTSVASATAAFLDAAPPFMRRWNSACVRCLNLQRAPQTHSPCACPMQTSASRSSCTTSGSSLDSFTAAPATGWSLGFGMPLPAPVKPGALPPAAAPLPAPLPRPLPRPKDGRRLRLLLAFCPIWLTIPSKAATFPFRSCH